MFKLIVMSLNSIDTGNCCFKANALYIFHTILREKCINCNVDKCCTVFFFKNNKSKIIKTIQKEADHVQKKLKLKPSIFGSGSAVDKD